MRQKLQISKQSKSVKWHFLTGDEDSIRNLADQVGMSYFYDTKSRQYAHPNLLITLDQDAKILAYFHGINWQNTEIENSFVNPNHGNRNLTAIDRTLSYILTCFKYPSLNAALNGPILASVRILGAITVTLLMIVLTKGWWS
jgi:protein SCO1/2